MLALSSKADIVPVMPITHKTLLSEIDAFLAETGMGPSYFGKKAARNSEVVSRLREGRRIWPETEAEIRSFIRSRRKQIASVSTRHGDASCSAQDAKNVAPGGDA